MRNYITVPKDIGPSGNCPFAARRRVTIANVIHTHSEFYPYYLGEHRNTICRRLHLVGTSVSLAIQARVLLSLLPALVARFPHLASLAHSSLNRLHIEGGFKRISSLAALGFAQAYVWAWIGHYFL